MQNEPWVHVYVCSPETIHQVFDPKEVGRALPKPPDAGLKLSRVYAIALRILIILSRFL